MAFFDQFGKKLSKAGQDVAQSTKNLATISKYNSLIEEENEKIKMCFFEIGKTYFNNYSDNPDEKLSELVEGVKMSMCEIEKFNEQIKEIKGITNCLSCGKEVSYESAFCNYCGAKMPERKKEEVLPADSIKCSKCSNILPVGFKFCTFCGAAIELSEEVFDEGAVSNLGVKVCPDCGKELVEEAAFCTECGHKF